MPAAVEILAEGPNLHQHLGRGRSACATGRRGHQGEVDPAIAGRVVRNNLENVEGIPAGGIQQPEDHAQLYAAGLQVPQRRDGSDPGHSVVDWPLCYCP